MKGLTYTDIFLALLLFHIDPVFALYFYAVITVVSGLIWLIKGEENEDRTDQGSS
ncbi:MAG: hypothetical protein ACYS7Y_04455 [Planctomycetota bacterium]|jgi:hypothetical protein